MQTTEPLATQQVTQSTGASLVKRIAAWEGWRSDFIALVGFVLIIMLMSYPLAFRLGAGLGGRDIDTWMKLWDNWWFGQVVKGQNWLHTPYLFYPRGLDLRFHSISWFTAALAWLFSLALGPVVGYNLTTLVITLLCAYCGYRLALYLFDNRLLGWLGGVLFAIFPVRNGIAGSWPDFSNLQWLPLIVLFAMLSAKNPRRLGFAVLTGVAVALTAWTSYYIFAVALVLIMVLYVYLALDEQRWRDPIFWRQAVLAGSVAIVLMLPRLIPLFTNISGLDTALKANSDATTTQVDLVTFFIPSPYHGLFYRFYRLIGAPTKVKLTFYLGLVPISLMISSLWSEQRRKLTIWYSLIAVYLVLALGTELKFRGTIYPIWMPARLVHWLPFIRGVRPHIFALGLALPVAILTVAGAGVWLRRIQNGSLKMGVLAALIAVICFEYWTGRVVMQDTAVSPFYQQIAHEAGEFALIDLPMGRQESKRYEYYQTVHSRPIVEGVSGRPVPGMKDYITSNKLLYAWNRNNLLDCQQVDYVASLQALEDDGFRYIIVHKDLTTGQVWDTMPAYFASDPYYSDKYLLAYRISDLLANPTPCDAPSTR